MGNQLKNKVAGPWILLSVVFPLLLILLILTNISLGSVNIPLPEVLKILTGGEASEISWQHIVIDFRLPKTMTAIVVGAGLAVSGLLMQTLFNNPLAGPFVLGITSGASLGVALLMMSGYLLSGIIYEWVHLGNWMVVIAGSIGSAMVLLVVLLVSLRVKSSMTLLIIGLLFGSTTGALVSIIQFFSSKEDIQSYLFWTFGSLGGLTWDELLVLVPMVLIGLLMAMLLIKPLNALLLGETYAQSVGVNIKAVRVLIIIATSILAGSITSFAGPIAFIGIAVPHLTRMSLNTGNHLQLIVGSLMLGIMVMLICDIISQLPGSQYVIPINAVTSLFGAPMVIWIILTKRDIQNSFN